MAKVASPPRESAASTSSATLKSIGPRTPKRSASKAALARALLGKNADAKPGVKALDKFSSPSSSSRAGVIESPDRRSVKKSSKRRFGTPQSKRKARSAAAGSSSLRSLASVGKKAAFSISAATSIAASTTAATAAASSSPGVAEDGVIELDSALREQLRKRMKVVYSVVNTFHEPIPPVGCDDYAITGNVTPGSYLQYMDLLCAEDSPVPREYRLRADSTFIDIGSGMGRPPMCVAALPIKAAFGVELQPLCAGMSMLAMKKLFSRQKKSPVGDMGYAPCFFSRGDLMTIPTLDGITHVYSFNMGMPEFVQKRIIALAAWSDDCRTLTLFDRSQPAKFVRWGILEDAKANASELTWRLSMAMPGGHSYGMHVICMTPERRANLRAMYADPREAFAVAAEGEQKNKKVGRKKGSGAAVKKEGEKDEDVEKEEEAWRRAAGHVQFSKRAWAAVTSEDSFSAWIASIDGGVLDDEGGSADGAIPSSSSSSSSSSSASAAGGLRKLSPLKRRSSRQRQNAEKKADGGLSVVASSPKKRRSSRRQKDAEEKKKASKKKGQDENEARGN